MADPGHRPRLQRARLAGELPRAATRTAAGHRDGGPAGDRRGVDLAQPLRPPRPPQRRAAERTRTGPHALPGAAGHQALPHAAGHQQRDRAGLVGHPHARRRAIPPGAGAALVRARPGRPQPDPVGRLGGVRGRLALVLLRRRGVQPPLPGNAGQAGGAARARRRAVRRRAAGDRRLRAALVHEGAAYEPVGCASGAQGPRRPPQPGHPLGHLRAHGRGAGPAAARPGAGTGAAGLAEQDFFVLPIGGTWWPVGPPVPAPKQ